MPAPTPGAGPATGSARTVTSVRLTASTYGSPQARELTAELQAEYVQRYGSPDDAPLAAEELAPPSGAFFVAHAGEELVGMVGLRAHDGDDDTSPGAGLPSAEMKRLYVRAGHRRRGYARAILALTEQRALELGYGRLVLETGTEQPEAMALYAAQGYHRIPGFGHYSGEELSRCFAKVLRAG